MRRIQVVTYPSSSLHLAAWQPLVEVDAGQRGACRGQQDRGVHCQVLNIQRPALVDNNNSFLYSRWTKMSCILYFLIYFFVLISIEWNIMWSNILTIITWAYISNISFIQLFNSIAWVKVKVIKLINSSFQYTTYHHFIVFIFKHIQEYFFTLKKMIKARY